MVISCFEVAMSDVERESEARCMAMLNKLISEVKKQTVEMEDLAVSMNGIAVGLKAITQPQEAPVHALPPSGTAPTATLVAAVDHAMVATTPCAEVALAPESPTKCSTSGPDTVTPTRCSTACRSCNIDVAITGPKPSDATNLVRDGTCVLTSTPSGATFHSIDLGDKHVLNLSSRQLGARKVFDRMRGTDGISCGFSTITTCCPDKSSAAGITVVDRADYQRERAHRILILARLGNSCGAMEFRQPWPSFTYNQVGWQLKSPWPPPKQDRAMGSTEQRPTPWPSLKCYWSAAPLDSASGDCVDAITYVPGVSRHRTIMNIFEKETRIHKDVFVAPSAAVIGDVQIGPGSSLWYGSILRGDVNNIHIESGTNMQDNSLVRVPRSNISGKALPTIIGSNVTVGHSAVLHACTIEDEAFVGMGATLLDGVVVEKHSMVGAGSLVKQNTRISAGEVRVGNPAKFLRRLTEEEIAFNSQSTTNYINLAQLHEAENATSFEYANYVTDLSVSVLSSQFKAVNLPEFNLFKGGIPESVTALPKLTVLGAPKAGLEGNVPSNWGRCHSLRMVNLAQNLLFGVIPRGLGQCSNLKFLNLSSNRLSGSLGNDLYPHLIVVFDVSGDELSGSIPAFVNKGCSSQLMLDDMQSDYSLLVMFEAVAELSLGYCDSGERSVVCHNFAKYNFGGHLTSLPFSADRFGNKTLYAFLVDHSNFTGSLDAILLEQCGNLNGLIVSFRDNKISGGLTAEISTKCRVIRVLDLASNQISGVMPANICLLVALVNTDISRNFLEGQIPTSFKDFKSLKFLSLAGNNLSGHIPSCFGQLRSLEVLDLSSNSPSGNIPSSLVTLKDLTGLLLNNNKLFGNISNLNQLQTSLLLVEVFVSGLPRYTSYLKIEHRFQEWGLEKGWGDTAERCKETLNCLSEVLQASDPINREKFFSMVASIFNIVVFPIHGYLGQEEVPDAKSTKCNAELEPVGTTKQSNILHMPLKTEDGKDLCQWVSQFDIDPDLERHAQDAAAKILDVLEGKPDLTIGNYTDGNLVASLRSGKLGVTRGTIAHLDLCCLRVLVQQKHGGDCFEVRLGMKVLQVLWKPGGIEFFRGAFITAA